MGLLYPPSDDLSRLGSNQGGSHDAPSLLATNTSEGLCACTPALLAIPIINDNGSCAVDAQLTDLDYVSAGPELGPMASYDLPACTTHTDRPVSPSLHR
jgi:hypothetical protein